MKKEFHITYRASKESKFITGVNIKSESMLGALCSFMKDYDCDPIMIEDKTQHESVKAECKPNQLESK